MLRLASGIEELERKVNQFVDCYVSTDSAEVGDILVALGFQDATYHVGGRRTLAHAYETLGHFDLDYCTIKNDQTSLEIDCIDVPFKEALEKREDINFMPMSKFRVYLNGSPNAVKILLPIIKGLDKERQNFAFFDEKQSVVYVKLSEFF